MIKEVELSEQAESDLRSCPVQVQKKLRLWVVSVQLSGLEEVRKMPGYHDEPLKGRRKGQRSIRLNKAYRAFYCVRSSRTVEFVEVIEVNKHKY